MPAPFSSGRPGSRRGRYRPLAEINVTPLVDVMLVLLIIFMVTAPLMTSGVSIDLPKTDAQPLNNDSQPLTVSIDAQGQIFLQSDQVDLDALVAKLRAVSQNDPGRRIFVRGDKDLAYGRIMQVMGTITQGGFTKVALLAEQTARPTPGPPSSAPSSSAPKPAGRPAGGRAKAG
ncbi:MAG: protein TolR [Pseudomonadota bacterium]|nr:protein TolR [Pseudomonadota bacterium]